MNTPRALEPAVIEDVGPPAASLGPLAPQAYVPPDASSLEESEASYRILFESNPQPMWITDCETLRFLLVNEAAIEHYGYSLDEFLAMTLMDILPAADVPILSEVLSQVKRSGVPSKGKRGVWRHKKKDGQIIDVEITNNELRFRGRAARLAMVNDITESRRIERALQQSEREQRQLAEHLEKERERLAEAQAIAKVGNWERDLMTGVLIWSEETYRIFGMDPFGAKVSPEDFFERIHPDDRAALISAYTESVASHTPYAFDHRVQIADGSIKIVTVRSKTIYDASGRPIRSMGTVQDITEQRQSEQTLHHIMEGAHCLLWQAEVGENEEGQIRWNMQIASEQSAQRFLPLHVEREQAYENAWYYSRPLEDRERTDLYGDREILAGRNYQQEYRCHSKDGTLHWLSENVRVEVLGEGKWRCTGVCIDITERKLAEEAARAMTRGAQCLLWYAFVEEQPHGIQWHVKLSDEEAAKQFFPVRQSPGQSYAEALARNRLPGDIPVMDATSSEALLSGQQGYTNQFRCLRADGEWRWLNETVSIELLTPGRWHCVGVCIDITEQKRAEEERDRFFKAKNEADAANHAKSEFLSRMSHELRTPLNAILGFGQILDKEATLTPLQQESVQYILTGGRHLLALINEVLDLARVESGHIELSLEPIALAEIVCESCALVRPLAAERNISIEVSAAEFGGRHVHADRQRLKQALINLLSNAIKYNRAGGQVKVYGIPHRDDRLAIAVADTGPGITVEDQQRLFVPFERLNAALSGVEGTGLGLVMAQRLVTAMGGALTLDSLPGKGSTFFLDLPLVLSPIEALAEQTSGVDAPDRSAEPRATILYVEDNLSNMRLLEVLLRSRPSITLLPAMQGSIGLDLARQHTPDLILLDLNLPDISGKEVLARLQASALTRDIPVIVLSADATTSQIERLLSGGARAYLTKPLDVAEFLHTMDTLLFDKKTDCLPGEERR